MPETVPPNLIPLWFRLLTAFLFGISIGSFLNVVIYRLPKGKSLTNPSRSFCPNCGYVLTGFDLVPLLSFLFLGRKCRKCRQPISWRYFLVELLTGALFVALAWRFSTSLPLTIAHLLFVAILISVFFIDLETFTIPDTVNLCALAIPIALDVWGIAQKEPGHELVMGWLPRSLLGYFWGWFVFAAVRLVGYLWKQVEAMGLGDVLLARAMGAMIALLPGTSFPMLIILWVLLSCLAGAVIGVVQIAIRNRQALPEAVAEEPNEEEPSSYGAGLKLNLREIAWSFYLGDLIGYILYKMGKIKEAPLDDDDFKPAPTAIPFGPYLVAGFLLVVFFGQALANAYLKYAFPAQP